MALEIHDLSVRELRQRLGPMLDRVQEGAQIVVRRNGKVVARIIPEQTGDPATLDNPLKGSLMSMADDFDDALDDDWEALAE